MNNPFPVSNRCQQTGYSLTAAVVLAAEKLKAQGVSIVDLGAGEPDFPTPAHIKAAAYQAIETNFTKYTSASGIAPLRAAVADSINQQFGSDYTPDQCCITLGGKQGIFNAVLALINAGDDVLVEKPRWVSFPEIVHLAEGRVVNIETEATDFHLTAEMVKAALTPQAKLLIINSPSNPTGRIIAPDEFRRIIELAADHNLWVISDECYLQLVYPPHQPLSAAALPKDLRERVLIAGSLSKTYAMTGWRLGYTLANQAWTNEVVKIQSQSATHAASIAQKAAIAALTSPQDCVQEMLDEYAKRADWLIPALNEIPGVTCAKPEGAFYAFPNIKGLMAHCGFASSQDVAHELLYHYGVVLTAGAAFGAEGYLRLSFANSLYALQETVERIQRMVRERSTQ
jgi:aspartate aminotransferase